jgi:SAM-dependent methyltransferase
MRGRSEGDRAGRGIGARSADGEEVVEVVDVLSHGRFDDESFEIAISEAQERIATIPVELGTQDQLLADLEVWSQSEFGRWMLLNGGWNGYWTRYVIGYPDRVAAGEPAVDNEVERFFLTQSPGIVATQQRFKIFQQVFRELIGPDSVVLEVPCGVLDDLLTMPDLPGSATVIGVDVDAASLELALETASVHSRVGQVVLAKADAWDLANGSTMIGDTDQYLQSVNGNCDVVTSNGLNIYVPDDGRVLALYRSFADALKVGGHAVISALAPRDQWQIVNVESWVLRRAHALNLINGVGWLNLRSRELTIEQLGNAGLQVIEIRDDAHAVYPTFVARKVS